MDEVRIVPTGEQYADGFNAVVDAVARERCYENAPHRKR